MDPIDYSALLDSGYKEITRDYRQLEDEGLPHYCFGCSDTNPYSMHLKFFYKPGETEVFTIYKLREEYCGFPLFSHGGIVATLLDEVMAYATYHALGAFGVTKTMNINYKRPVYIGKTVFIRANVIESVDKGKKLEVKVEGSIHEGKSGSGPVCDTGTAVLVVLPTDRFKESFIKPS